MKKYLLYALLPLLLLNSTSYSQISFTKRVVAGNLFIPWEIVYGPDDHIWFTQKNGYICRLYPNTEIIDTLYHETNAAVLGEGACWD